MSFFSSLWFAFVLFVIAPEGLACLLACHVMNESCLPACLYSFSISLSSSQSQDRKATEQNGVLLIFSPKYPLLTCPHSIVGKGNHSPNHIQKIKPKVEQICQELGLQYATEENAGRMYINLQGGPAVMPEHLKAKHGGGYHQGYGGGPGYGGGQHQQQQQGYQGGNTYPQMNYQQGGGGGGGGQYQGGGGGGQQDPNAEIEAEVKKYLPQVLRMCQKQCCTVM